MLDQLIQEEQAREAKASQAPKGSSLNDLIEQEQLREATEKKRPGQVVIRNTPQTGMPSAGDFDFGTSAKQVGGHVYRNFIEPQILPLATSLAATRLPALAVRGIGSAIAAPALEGAYQGAAGYLGDKLNQLAGISPDGEDGALTQGGIQGLVAAGQKALRVAYPWVGRKGAVTGNQIAETEARREIAKHMPQVESQTLFDEAAKDKASIPMDQTYSFVRNKINSMLSHDPTANRQNLGAKLKQNYGAAGEAMYKIYQHSKTGPNMMSDTWHWQHTRLGHTIGAMGRSSELTSKLGESEAKGLYGSMLDDLERAAEHERSAKSTGVTTHAATAIGAAPTSLGATKLLAALRTYRKEQSVARLQQYVEDAMRPLSGHGTDEKFNAAKVSRQLDKDRFFPKAFTPQEQKEIKGMLGMLNRVPPLPTPAGVDAGSKRVMERAAAATAGNVVGGLPAAVAGYALKDLGTLGRNFAFAASTKVGRELLKELNKSPGGVFNKRGASVLAAYATASKNQPMEGDQ